MRVSELTRYKKWYKIFEMSNIPSGWNFDSFRISGDTSKIKVGITPRNTVPNTFRSGFDSYGSFIYGSGFIDTKNFSSTNSEQHDFQLNFSGLDYGFWISGLDNNNSIIEIVKNTSEGGFSDIDMWIPNNGIYADRLELQNQNMQSPGFWFALYDSYNLFTQSTYIDVSNCYRCEPNDIDAIIISVDNSGNSSGTLIYTGINFTGDASDPTNASRAAYDSLIAKGWTITGTPPPTS